MRALMFGWISSAMATASSSDSTLPKTCDCALVTGGVVAGMVTGGADCDGAAGGVVAGGGAVGVCGAMGVCAAAFAVMITSAAPVSSNRRTDSLIVLHLLGPETRTFRAPVMTAASREYHAPLPSRPGRRPSAPIGEFGSVDVRWIRWGCVGNGPWTDFCLTNARYCVLDCPSPQDIGGAPHAVRDPSRQSRQVDRARPARPPRALPPPQGRRGDRDAGGDVLASRGLDCCRRGTLWSQPGGREGGRGGLLRHDGGRLLHPEFADPHECRQGQWAAVLGVLRLARGRLDARDLRLREGRGDHSSVRRRHRLRVFPAASQGRHRHVDGG